MTTKEDLLSVFETAFRHLRPGGIVIAFAEYCKESFSQNRTTASTYRSGDMEVTFIENYYDPSPRGETFEATFIYLIREKGELRIEHDFHTMGLFPLETWRKALKETGFEVIEEMKLVGDDEMPVFACVKPR